MDFTEAEGNGSEIPKQKYRFPTSCGICKKSCQYHYFGVACCVGCKHFFRRSAILCRDYTCRYEGKCNVLIENACKSCRLDKCISAGMDAESVRAVAEPAARQKMMEFLWERRRRLAKISPDDEESPEFNKTETGAAADEEPFVDKLHSPSFAQMLNYLSLVENHAKKIRYSITPVNGSHYSPQSCSSLYTLLRREANLLVEREQFQPGTPPRVPPDVRDRMRKFGPFQKFSPLLGMDLLMVVEIAKTMPFFRRLEIQDQFCLISNNGMPIFVLNKAYNSYLQKSNTFVSPSGDTVIMWFTGEKYQNDKNVSKLAMEVFNKSMEPFNRVQLTMEEFVLIRAIMYSHMATNGLSPTGQQVVFEEAQKYTKVLMQMLQASHGPVAGALKFAEAMHLIEWCFRSGHRYANFLTYISTVHEPMFVKVMPQALVSICTRRDAVLPELLGI